MVWIWADNLECGPGSLIDGYSSIRPRMTAEISLSVAARKVDPGQEEIAHPHVAELTSVHIISP